jgi:aminocarboxymuconate-semialdehyde decarboxylase
MDVDGVNAHPVIDCHAHAVPPALCDVMVAGRHGFSAEPDDSGWWVTTPDAARRRLLRPMVDPAARRRRMVAQGVDQQVLSPWLELIPPANVDTGAAREWVQVVNDHLREFAAELDPSHPGILAALGTHDPELAARDVRMQAACPDVLGGVLTTNPAGVDGLDDPRLEPLWAAAEDTGFVLMVHPSTVGPASAIEGSAEYGNTWCRLVDTTFAVSRLLLSGVLDRHPRLRLIVVHGGGFLPYQARRLDGGHRADALSDHTIERHAPSAYLADLMYDTVALSENAIRLLTEVAGPERVLLGTDYPFPLGDPDPVGAVVRSGVDRAVLGRNLAALRRNP